MTNNHHTNLLAANRTAFLVMGCIEASWAPIVPYIKEAYGLDEGQLGMLLLCSGVGAVAGLPLAGPLCMRQGARRTVIASGIILATSILLLSLFLGVWATALFLVTFGICTTIIDVSANINGIAVEKRTERHLMSSFHGGYSLGNLLGAGGMSVLFTIGFAPLPAVIICMALTIAAMLWFCRGLLTKEELNAPLNPAKREKPQSAESNLIPSLSGEGQGGVIISSRSEGAGRGLPLVLVVGFLCFIMYASEGAVMSWSAVFVSQERGVDIAYAGYFYTVFAVMMTLVRLFGDKVVARLGRRLVVSLGALFVTIGFAATALIPSASATVFGLALVGLGAANIVPQLVSFAGGIQGMPIEKIISAINAIGYSGILLGPVIIGFVAKHFSLPAAFLCIATGCLLVAVVAWRIIKELNEQEHMKKTLTIAWLTALMMALSMTANAQDLTAERRIAELGASDNQTWNYLSTLTGRFGGRPIGSATYEDACQWLLAEFKKLGIEAHLEEAGEVPVGFNRGPWWGRAFGKENFELHFGTPSYTSGTAGRVRGHVVIEPKSQREFDAIKRRVGTRRREEQRHADFYERRRGRLPRRYQGEEH